uniref:Uncharacterized protein n=1 Tax=Parascaris univalens TaxID=6257 RepID=A0A915A591_PARUN
MVDLREVCPSGQLEERLEQGAEQWAWFIFNPLPLAVQGSARCAQEDSSRRHARSHPHRAWDPCDGGQSICCARQRSVVVVVVV